MQEKHIGFFYVIEFCGKILDFPIFISIEVFQVLSIINAQTFSDFMHEVKAVSKLTEIIFFVKSCFEILGQVRAQNEFCVL